jgi:hypothetical protein
MYEAEQKNRDGSVALEQGMVVTALMITIRDGDV